MRAGGGRAAGVGQPRGGAARLHVLLAGAHATACSWPEMCALAPAPPSSRVPFPAVQEDHNGDVLLLRYLLCLLHQDLAARIAVGRPAGIVGPGLETRAFAWHHEARRQHLPDQRDGASLARTAA